MTDQQITAMLEEYTAANSNFEDRRNYISLSHCHLSAEEILAQFNDGFQGGLLTRLKCYKGYQMERDLMARIIATFGKRIDVGLQVSAYDNLVQGHPDFCFDNYPGDCKSVLMDDWIPNGKLPRKVYYQMQGYMLYSGAPKSLVIYESRETGILKAFWIHANKRLQSEIDAKLSTVVKQLQEAKLV